MKNFLKSILVFIVTAIIFSACRSSGVVVRERPVAPVYSRPAPPRPNYIWIEPSYIRSGRGYAYRPGYWIQPRNNRVYHQGYWKQTSRGYVYVPGRW